jgi:GDP-mannose 6-dehydrogenase
MNISIFGLGYVGCVSIGCLANNGHKVIGVDVSKTKVDLINSGNATIIEKDIDVIIKQQYELGRISATTDYNFAVKNSDISVICVGTPSAENGHLDLRYIRKTAQEIGASLKDKNSFHIVVIRSTVMPGTNEEVGRIIAETSGKKRNVHFTVVSNPEFLREGSAVEDYYNPSVTVIGGDHEEAVSTIKEMYKEIDAPFAVVDIKVAEIIKYVNNSWHALKITFANEVGNIAKKLGIDSHSLMNIFVMDTRLNLSPYYMKPGFAYGGSCLPKDLKGLRTIAHDHYLSTPVLDAIENSNLNQKQIAFHMITSKGKKNIGILGLSFKKGTDDLRYSPIVEVAEMLFGKGYHILIHDEKVNLSKITGTNKEYIDHHIPHLSELIRGDLEEVINASDVLVVTQKDQKYSEALADRKDKIIIDLVRLSNTGSLQNYEGICW